jgi:hypothetical protein
MALVLVWTSLVLILLVLNVNFSQSFYHIRCIVVCLNITQCCTCELFTSMQILWWFLLSRKQW